MLHYIFIYLLCFLFVPVYVHSKELEKTGVTYTRIIDDPSCKHDIANLCERDLKSSVTKTNFEVLECIQNQERNLSEVLSEECHHTIWIFKHSLSKIGIDSKYLDQLCLTDLGSLTESCSSSDEVEDKLKCLANNLGKLKNEKCKNLVARFSIVLFSDYSLISDMTEACEEDIKRFICGRIQNYDKQIHSQGLTIECLSKHTAQLRKKCKHQILRLAELQSEDFHLDRAFYFACREDRNKFCGKIRAGSGRVYKCLMKHMSDRNMSPECVEQLSRRQNLVAEDYQVSRGLAKACKNDIAENKCRKGLFEDNHDVKLSKILLCLESALRKGMKIDNHCQAEMLSHRQMVMENFKMSPDLVAACDNEIKNLCDASVQSDTLHCLMQHAKKSGRRGLAAQCERELETVIRQVDIAEDWRVDPVLFDACLTVKESRCSKLTGGEGRVIRCLMRQINSHFMTPQCESALMEIQYFVARDWKLDPELYKACYNESMKMCHAQQDWYNAERSYADSSILVLPCLFRYAYHPSAEMRLSRLCNAEVHRVMHERATYVNLHPFIERECIGFLSSYCSENTGPGEEIACLQQHYGRLPSNCQVAIRNYTEAEAQDVGLNSLLMQHCADVMEQVCSHIFQTVDGSEGEDMMECLIKKKSKGLLKGYPKCKAVLDNFQVAMMEEVVFPTKFKEECHDDVRQYCLHAQNRKEIIDCLSKQHLSDILKDEKSSISRKCRDQLKKLIYQRHENYKMDTTLKNTCRNDIEKFCPNESGYGRVLECLRHHQTNLENGCHTILFIRELEESVDPQTDVYLLNNCNEMLKTFCHDTPPEQIFTCLVREKEKANFDSKCYSTVVSRMIEHSNDIRLNPLILKTCRKERKIYCATIPIANLTKLERNGVVINCLKKHLFEPEAQFSHDCRQKLMLHFRQSVLNYKMNPILVKKCTTDMKTLCPDQLVDNKGNMEECLKQHFQNGNIKSAECQEYLAESVNIERADIHLDPILYKTCYLDFKKYCSDGEDGTHLSCLLNMKDRKANLLDPECRTALQNRENMYKVAYKVKFESIGDFVTAVDRSVDRSVVMLILAFLLLTTLVTLYTICKLSHRSFMHYKKR